MVNVAYNVEFGIDIPFVIFYDLRRRFKLIYNLLVAADKWDNKAF
jgi:hypothetical protein